MSNVTKEYLVRPKHVISLQSSCVLVSIPVRIWTATKQDQESSDELTTSKKAERDAAKVTQHLLANNLSHKKLTNYRQTIYNWLERWTYPWAGKQYLLPTALFPKFMKEFEEHKAAFQKLCEEFYTSYPSAVSDAAFKMGDMFDRRNYPSLDEIKSKFGIGIYVSEVPSGDFRNALAEDLAQDFHNHYNEQARKMLVEDVYNKQVDQILKVMQSISHCCEIETSIESDGTTKVNRRRIYDTTIKRALELCDTLKEFNPTENAALDDARLHLSKALQDVTVETLRESDTLRERVKTDMDSILSKFR